MLKHRWRLLPHHLSKHYSTKLSYWHEASDDPLRALTVGQLLEQTAKKFEDRKAIISRHQNSSITFKNALEEADRLAAGFHKLGLEKGDRLGLWAPNLLEWYLVKMACARAGLILAALNPLYTAPEMNYCINKIGMKAIVVGDVHKSQNYHELMMKISPELVNCDPGRLKSDSVPSLQTVITISGDQKKGVFTFEEVKNLGRKSVENIKKNQNSINPDDPFGIQFTSGTTGKPKAAVTSHFNAVNNGYYMGKRQELFTKHHKICLQVPLFHAFGLTISQMAALNHGATLVLPSDGYNPDKTLDALMEEKCTIIHGTPTMYVDLVHKQEERKEDICAEIALSGGAICSPHLFQSMLHVLKVKKVKSVYGLSETTASVTFSMIEESEELATSTVGRVLDHTQVKIVDENENMVPMGTAGELWVRSYCNMLGYWDDAEKTKEMIRSDGWLKTGDQFVLYENGYGRIVGRLKEMIIRGGENIFPKEIEDLLNTHPSVLECHVIGVPHERLGEEVCACVRTKPNTTLSLEDIKEFCKEKIANFKIPRILQIVQEFPKTTSGKIQKFKLIESCKK